MASFGLLSIASGFTFGTLSAFAVHGVYLGVVGSSAAWAIASLTGIGTFIGLGTIFFFVIADFYKESRYNQIKDYFATHEHACKQARRGS